MGKKITAALLLAIMLLSGFTFIFQPAPAAAIDTLMPSEEEMGYDVQPADLSYRKYPISHYKWDTSHRWFVMEGLRPVTGDAEELMGTIIANIIQSVNSGMNILAIFFLQSGFTENMLDGIVGQINDLLRPVKSYFFEQVFWIVSLVLVGLMLIKYARARKGKAFPLCLKPSFIQLLFT